MRELLRKNIANLVPYSCARNDFVGEAEVYLDANENWRDFVGEEGRNRYPDPLCIKVRKALDEVMGLPFANTVIGNGSDEIIDNLFRCFCNPGLDKAIIMSPTYGAYRVFADINDVLVQQVSLTPDFAIDFEALEAFLEQENKRGSGERIDGQGLEGKSNGGRSKLLFICSPNNPTGNAYPLSQIERVCTLFDGITVVDEAYGDFSSLESATTLLPRFPRLVVLRTLSKCWSLANARIGIAIASEEICKVLTSMKYPYNVGGPSQDLALRGLAEADKVREALAATLLEKKRMEASLPLLSCVVKVFPSDANFLLVRVGNADELYHYLAQQGIIVR
ncbi:MAG TPA: aminotransferase class I/II-fold pyridoxal phosphate-dependent enzyme, partial [Sphaerochaeta sp.]|nr:aminotransferase class I/II-fold pyridoxal phosphate-dependent enzyme [Sphaerochaeta sp.]